MRGYGVGIPTTGLRLMDHRDLLPRLMERGYTDAWSSEANGTDAFTPLALASTWVPELRLGVAVVPVQTRGPGVLAQTAATLAEATAAPVVIGIGASSPAVVEGWNGIPYDRPYYRARDVIRFLRQALNGDKVSGQFVTFSTKGFKLADPPKVIPKIMLAAGREQMLRLAGREADGAILNWVAPHDIPKLAEIVREAAGGSWREIVARIFVCPSTDADVVRPAVRRFMVTYLAVSGYREYHTWVGRGDRLAEVFEKWDQGDHAGAAAAIPDDIIDELVVHGSAEQCRKTIDSYYAAGVDTTILTLLPINIDPVQALLQLAPDPA